LYLLHYDVTTAVTTDNSRVTAGGFKQGARKFSLMMAHVTPKHAAETVRPGTHYPHVK